MRIKDNAVEIEAPEGVTLSLEGHVLKVQGEKGSTSREFFTPGLTLSQEGNKVIIKAKRVTKNMKTSMGTFSSHIQNMMRSVSEGITYKLKVCSGHFPMNVQVKGNEFVVNNFIGEKFPRTLVLKHPEVKVAVEGEIVEVTGFDKEKVAQTAAEIESLMKRTAFDKRIFQDGIYLIEKDGKPVK